MTFVEAKEVKQGEPYPQNVNEYHDVKECHCGAIGFERLQAFEFDVELSLEFLPEFGAVFEWEEVVWVGFGVGGVGGDAA